MNSPDKQPKTVVLVAFYNSKALGVRYLETALRRCDYHVVTVFFKNFNSVNPQKCTEYELSLLCDLIQKYDPCMIGLSVMSSMYLDTVNDMISRLQKDFSIPLCAGGAFASMFPEYFLERGVDYVIRSDGERAICRLADAVVNKSDYTWIPSLCYKKEGKVFRNEISDIAVDIDEYGIPAVKCDDAYMIDHDTLHTGDPQLDTRSYEVIASRGCPFTCSYCCCVNLHRLMPKGTPAVRSRSVESVIEELKTAKRICKKLVYVHFYDEIFPTTPGWVDHFIEEYKKHIALPFTIWSHPKMVKAEVLKKLKKAGLMEVVMGIQSGSDHIRKEVFHRYETREDILKACRTIKECGVFWASYDFMLQHPFETVETMKETYYLVKEMQRPYELQLHGLNFLPGTDIVKMAIDAGHLSEEEMNHIMYAPMAEQFSAYWKRENEVESQLWYQMTYCQQFKTLRRKMWRFEEEPLAHRAKIEALYHRGQKLYKLRYLYRKLRIAVKGKFHI